MDKPYLLLLTATPNQTTRYSDAAYAIMQSLTSAPYYADSTTEADLTRNGTAMDLPPWKTEVALYSLFTFMSLQGTTAVETTAR